MRFAGYAMFVLMTAFAAAEHQRAHDREAAYWRGEWIDDDFDPDYRHWWERQVPEAERWKPKEQTKCTRS